MAKHLKGELKSVFKECGKFYIPVGTAIGFFPTFNPLGAIGGAVGAAIAIAATTAVVHEAMYKRKRKAKLDFLKACRKEHVPYHDAKKINCFNPLREQILEKYIERRADSRPMKNVTNSARDLKLSY